jgi:hypothetical protein
MRSKLTSFVLVLGLASALSACTTPLAQQYRDVVASAVALEPDRTDLQSTAADAAKTMRQIERFDEIGKAMELEAQGMPRDELNRHLAELAAAKRRYVLRAAKLAKYPKTSFRLVSLLLAGKHRYEETDEEVLDAARSYARARADLLQDTFPYVEKDKSLCVLATQPFSADDKPNPTVAFYFTGDHIAMHARCYKGLIPLAAAVDDVDLQSVPDVAKLTAYRVLMATNSDSDYVFVGPWQKDGSKPWIDARFVDKPNGNTFVINKDVDFAVGEVELIYGVHREWNTQDPDYRVDHYVKNDKHIVENSPFFWERVPHS